MGLKKLNESKRAKGFLFSLDAMFAVTLLVLGLLLISTMFISETRNTSLVHVSEDITIALGAIKIYELNDPFIDELIANGTLTNTNNSIVEQIGEFWAKNQTQYAQYLARNLTEGLIPDGIGYGIYAGGEELHVRNATITGPLVPSRKMVSGIEKGKPVLGATAQAFLVGIRQKTTSSYAYFGGFEGQGNITKIVKDIPADANVSAITMEVDSGGTFNLFVNNVWCGLFVPSAGYMEANVWDITNCNSSLNPGSDNEFELRFSSELNQSYIGGGYIKVDYATDELISGVNSGADTMYLPGIEGVINLYSSTHIPGTINDMSINLNLLSSFSTRLNIAGVDIVTIPGNTTNQTITIGDGTLSSLLNYSDLTLKTLPVRLGTLNISYYQTSLGDADVVLITDLSGSMAWQLDSNSAGTTRNCDSSQLNDSDTRRISLARCIDKEFVNTILEAPGNKVGLVGYDGTSDDWEGEGIKVSHNLSVDNSSLITQIENDYNTGGGTCICCAIDRAINMLTDSRIDLVAQGALWQYNTSYQFGVPPVDANGSNWNETYYDDSEWFNGSAPLGFGSVITSLKESGTVDLWELFDDLPQPVDFTSGINTTANTFGAGAGNDGWDWDCSTYGEGGSPPRDLCRIRDGDPSAGSGWGTDDGSDRLEVDIGGDNDENMDSGAWGIQLYINQTMIDIINNGGTATVSFDYDAYDREWVKGGWDETEESVWIKARFGDGGGMNWLGYDLDTGNGAGHAPTDATPEILYDRGVVDNVFWHTDTTYGDFDMDGDGDYNAGTYSEDVSGYISGEGWYYLDVGAVFDCTTGVEGRREGIVAYFDNFQMTVSNSSGDYYFRKRFTVSDPNALRNTTMLVYSDDNATVFINGHQVDIDSEEHTATQWNRNISINNSVLNAGDNVVAVKLDNDDSQGAAFDLQLSAGDSSRQQFIIVMTDGIAGYSCSPIVSECSGSSGDCNNAACQPAIDDAIASAQRAQDEYGITVHSVGFGPVDSCYNANYTLNNIASHGNGTYFASDNASDLQLIYTQIAEGIISATRVAQTLSISGNYSKSVLYPNSTININYTPSVPSPNFGEITVKLQTPRFENCSPTVYIYPNTRVLDAKITSYSAEHWTNIVGVDNSVVFNLSSYGDEYSEMGDPYTVNIPAAMLSSGNRTLLIQTGDDNDNSTGCSLNNSLIYSAAVQSTISYTEVLEVAEGCTWEIEFDDGTTGSMKVPTGYAGVNTCSFTSTNVSYNGNDTVQLAVYNLLDNLDFDNNNRSNINIEEQDMTINALWVPRVPYMWGPSVVEVRAWQ